MIHSIPQASTLKVRTNIRVKIVNKYRCTRETRYTVLLIVYLNRLLKTILLVTFITLSRVFLSKRIISCKCFRNKRYGQMDELSGNRMCVYFFLVFMFIAIIFVLLSTWLYIFSSRFFFLVSSIRFFHRSSDNEMLHQYNWYCLFG